jgi:hypothetical protein
MAFVCSSQGDMRSSCLVGLHLQRQLTLVQLGLRLRQDMIQA